ncbi:testis-expressed basic protein 1 isoform X3 [Peromyscus leucopus]|uniref:testis-expressed basic protein 1 isoform X3 n=1 Tax=Peromyscus leucopus TaxID=10041 RepID=UPI00188586F1|nr:testis-expressed basic protein 1 isoform X3 [Peromyscus leucopus]
MLWSAIPHKEVILAVTLTLLGLVILAILIARWTRRKQNVAQLSRYPSEQSAGLLDYEDGVSCARAKKGRGSRTSCSTESVPSAVCQERAAAIFLGALPTSSQAICRPAPVICRPAPAICASTPVICRPAPATCASTPAICRPPPAICQSTPALTISNPALCQGPGNKAKGSKSRDNLAGNAGHITGTIGPIMQFSAPIPGATGPIRLSQRTIVQTPGPIAQFTESSEEPSQACLPEGSNCAITPVAISCPPSPKTPVCATPVSVVRQDPVALVPFGCADGPEDGLFLEGCRDSLKKRMIGCPNESYTMLHKREIKRRVRPGMGLQGEGGVPMDQMGAARRRDSPRGQDSQVRFDPSLPPETMWCEPPRYRRPESKMRRTNDPMLKRQEWQGECPLTEHEFEYQYMKTATPPASWPPQRMASNAPPPAARSSKAAAPAPEAQPPPAGGAPAEAPAAPPPDGNPGGEQGDAPKKEKKRRKSQSGEEGAPPP